HLLPNVVAEHPIYVTQKVLDDEKASWADGGVKPAKGNFWVFTVKFPASDAVTGSSERTEESDKTVVVGKVGDSTVESKMKAQAVPVQVTQKVMDTKEKAATWTDGRGKAANGIYWTFKIKHKGDDKTLVVGEVGDPATEATIENLQRARINLPAILVV